MHESLNFGHEKFPAEDDGYYIGYTPMFNRAPDVENSKNVHIVFFISSDYRNSNRKAILGFYGFPDFGQWFTRTAEHPIYKTYNDGNIKAFPENIIYFENPIIVNNDSVQEHNLLPKGKKISQQGFNYLSSDNVYNLIATALQLNPVDKKLKAFVKTFPKETNDLEDFYHLVGESNPDTFKGIIELEQKMKEHLPEVKQRISSYIERGAIANKVKRMADYKCLVCESLGMHPLSFVKSNGDYYIETHHIEQVSTLKKGVLSIDNLMTVCANHHRQLHYGQTEIVGQTEDFFTIRLDDETISIRKINIS